MACYDDGEGIIAYYLLARNGRQGWRLLKLQSKGHKRMMTTVDLNRLQNAFAIAMKASERSAVGLSERIEFRAIANEIWLACGNQPRLPETSAPVTLPGVEITR